MCDALPMRKFLWQRDPPSEKDYRAETLFKAANLRLAKLPDKVRLDNLITLILDQLGLGSCAANATAQGLHAAQVRQYGGDIEYASRLMIYRYARAFVGDPTSDSGTALRACLDAIRKLGFCKESVWSYDDGPEKFKLLPSAEAQRQAHDQLGDFGYYRIDSSGDERCNDIRTAVAGGYTVIFGTLVTREFETWTPDQPPLGLPPPGTPVLGGHALTIAGYDLIDDYFDIVNSWSKKWGDRGWLKMRSSYIKDPNSADFWIIKGAPNYSE